MLTGMTANVNVKFGTTYGLSKTCRKAKQQLMLAAFNVYFVDLKKFPFGKCSQETRFRNYGRTYSDSILFFCDAIFFFPGLLTLTLDKIRLWKWCRNYASIVHSVQFLTWDAIFITQTLCSLFTDKVLLKQGYNNTRPRRVSCNRLF